MNNFDVVMACTCACLVMLVWYMIHRKCTNYVYYEYIHILIYVHSIHAH